MSSRPIPLACVAAPPVIPATTVHPFTTAPPPNSDHTAHPPASMRFTRRNSLRSRLPIHPIRAHLPSLHVRSRFAGPRPILHLKFLHTLVRSYTVLPHAVVFVSVAPRALAPLPGRVASLLAFLCIPAYLPVMPIRDLRETHSEMLATWAGWSYLHDNSPYASMDLVSPPGHAERDTRGDASIMDSDGCSLSPSSFAASLLRILTPRFTHSLRSSFLFLVLPLRSPSLLLVPSPRPASPVLDSGPRPSTPPSPLAPRSPLPAPLVRASAPHPP